MFLISQSLSFSKDYHLPSVFISMTAGHISSHGKCGGHLLSTVVQVVITQEETCIDGLCQQGVDGDHNK